MKKLLSPTLLICLSLAILNCEPENTAIRPTPKNEAWWQKRHNRFNMQAGNAENISQGIETIKIFNSLELNVFVYDYREYGKSLWEPSEKGTEKDAEAAWNYLTKIKKISDDDIIIFGRSLGDAVSISLAKKHTPGMLILESTFTPVKEVARFHLSCMPAGLVFGETYITLVFNNNLFVIINNHSLYYLSIILILNINVIWHNYRGVWGALQ